ncbi:MULTISPECIES: hypothetical protein [Burkholderia]|uniref:Uncharacterized protein n=1 Tax=Burkholderia sola TaxID=2843302 RepID=A0ABV2CHE1_9BURK|nr:hypothetical protein [Burkholderia sp. CpTa8-5]MBP0610529.1 hypothetical protein [Burkholderia sp. CpTa8-5]
MPTTNTHSPPATASGATNEPVAIDSITSVKVVMKMPAKLPAQFRMPPRDATCAGVGATPTRAPVMGDVRP